MAKELMQIIDQLKDGYTGEPWFGRNVKDLLNEADENTAFVKLHQQHSMLDLLWHMITWREFTINALRPGQAFDLQHFEEMDWRELDHTDRSLWKKGLQRLDETQAELVGLLEQQEDAILEQNVREKDYNYRKLLNGIIQHDVYHLGQIAYITKCLRAGYK